MHIVSVMHVMPLCFHYTNYVHSTNYNNVFSDCFFSGSCRSWSSESQRRAAIAKTVDDLGDQFCPDKRTRWLAYIKKAYGEADHDQTAVLSQSLLGAHDDTSNTDSSQRTRRQRLRGRRQRLRGRRARRSGAARRAAPATQPRSSGKAEGGFDGSKKQRAEEPVDSNPRFVSIILIYYMHLYS